MLRLREARRWHARRTERLCVASACTVGQDGCELERQQRREIDRAVRQRVRKRVPLAPVAIGKAHARPALRLADDTEQVSKPAEGRLGRLGSATGRARSALCVARPWRGIVQFGRQVR